VSHVDSLDVCFESINGVFDFAVKPVF
jgi:hypothetical protein